MTKFHKIYLINFLLYTHIQSFLCLSMYIYEVDDYVSKIEVDNFSIYPLERNPIIENIIYELGKTIIR